MTPAPKRPYAVSKLAGEHYAGLPACTGWRRWRCATSTFRPAQEPTSQYAAVIPIFMRTCADAGSAEDFGDGEQSRDFTYVDESRVCA